MITWKNVAIFVGFLLFADLLAFASREAGFLDVHTQGYYLALFALSLHIFKEDR